MFSCFGLLVREFLTDQMPHCCHPCTPMYLLYTVVTRVHSHLSTYLSNHSYVFVAFSKQFDEINDADEDPTNSKALKG